MYIDDENAAQLVLDPNSGTTFSELPLGVSPGPHTITFSYQYNPFNIPVLPPPAPERLGATWIDSVTFETMVEAPPGENALTTPGSVSDEFTYVVCRD